MDESVDAGWRRSSACAASGCVEVMRVVTGKRHGDHVYVRDSKSPISATLIFTADEWEAFLEGVRKGEFDL